MRKRGFLWIVMIMLTASIVLSACGGGSQGNNQGGTNQSGGSSSGNSSEDKVTIKFLNISQYVDTPEYKAFVERFEADNPNIEVETISVPHEQYINKRNIMLASG